METRDLTARKSLIASGVITSNYLAAGDAQPAFTLDANGKFALGPGGSTAPDTNGFTRRAAATLNTVSVLESTASVYAQQGNAAQVRLGSYGPSSEAAIQFGLAADTTIYRLAAGVPGVGAGIAGGVATKSASYTALLTDRTLLVDASGAARTITLPAVASAPVGKEYIVKKIDSSVNTVTLDGNASETIDGALTQVLTTQYDSLSIVNLGSAWYITCVSSVSGFGP